MTCKLLLADGSVTIQRVVELTFAGEDVDVVAVGDGDAAIARIPLERPDIVLADIGMSKRSGYDVAAFVKGHPDLSHIPVLLLAGAFEPVDESRAAQVKSDGVLVKPFEPQQVIARVRELVAGGKRRSAKPEFESPGAVLRIPAADPRTGISSEFGREQGPTPLAPRPAVRPAAVPPAASEPWTPDESLDRYFDQLDVALTTRGSAPTLMTPRQATSAAGADAAVDAPAEGSVPTIDEVLGDASLFTPPDPALTSVRLSVPEPPAETAPAAPPAPAARSNAPAAAPAPAPSTPPSSRPAAQATAQATPAAGTPANMADVFGALFAVEQGEPGAVRIHLVPAGVSPAVSDDLVEEVTRRVVERLAPERARTLVADVVAEVAERLVREEIARIRGQ